MRADYIIRGGRVIDPLRGIDEIRDVMVRNSRIMEAPAEEVECNPACIIDATGMVVTPGFIDYHTHLFSDGSSICIHPDMMIPQGTTAAVDAGSAGTSNYVAFRKTVIDTAQIHVKGYLTVYGGGQLDPKLCEDFNPALYNVDRMERIVEAEKDNLLGLKIRLSTGVVPTETGADYLRNAVQLADELTQRTGVRLRVCVHTTNPPVTTAELVECLRPGDIYTHCYQGAGNTIVRDDGSIDPVILRARERGVIFDSANGKGNFGIKTARAAIAAGFLPDVIASDLTVDKFNMPPYAKNLPLVMSKYLALGLNLPDIIKAVTETPAELMNMKGQIGTLAPGAYADIVIFDLKKKRYIQKDFCDDEIECNHLIVPQMTMLKGEIQFCQSDFWL